MFTKTAEYYDALYSFKDYGEAAAKLNDFIQAQIPGARSLLDVGCGTGRHLEYLSKKYVAEGLDLNTELLAVARRRCQNVEFHNGSMIDYHTGRKYDVIVSLFSSIAYVVTAENLYRTLANLSSMLNDGGLLVIEPWIHPESYWLGKLTFNHVNEENLKIAWMYLSELDGEASKFDIHYVVGTEKGVDTFNEVHRMGLWTDEQYREAFRRAGISVEHDPVGLFNRGLYYGKKLDTANLS